jgi:YhcH/YjgK/YiaL family protein
MVVDKISNAGLYASLSGDIAKAFGVLQEPGVCEKADGKYEVEGDELFYMVSTYATEPEGDRRFEGHEKYIDVQFIVEGCEVMGYAPVDSLTIQQAYERETDVAFYDTPDSFTRIVAAAGTFCIFYPEEGHMPCCQGNKPSQVKKIVVKIRA